MVVRIWAWLVTMLFKHRRVLIYMKSGRVIRCARMLDAETAEILAGDWKGWFQMRNRIISVKEVGGRVILLDLAEVEGVDIR